MESDGDRDDQNSSNSKGETVENTSKVAFDPGWNDPPKLSFGASGQTKFIKKGLLNKRVAFPLNSNSPTSHSSTSLQATPPKGDFCLPLSSGDSSVDSSTAHNPFINPFGLSQGTSDSPTPKNDVPPCSLNPDSELTKDKDLSPRLSYLEKVMDIFELAISNYITGCPTGTPEDGDKIEIDIRKRLTVMSSMWTEGKLNDDVQRKMVQLAEALDEGQGSLANNLHVELIVDHTGQVSAWMPGVRKLVHSCMLAMEKAQKLEDLKVDAATETQDKQTSDLDDTSEQHPSS